MMLKLEEEQISLVDKVARYERALNIFARISTFMISIPESEMFMSFYFQNMMETDDVKFMADIAREFKKKGEHHE